jgi:hypothetical protein
MKKEDIKPLQKFFFPKEEKTIEAETLEEAIKILNTNK